MESQGRRPREPAPGGGRASPVTLQNVLQALSDPVRRSIVRQLASAEEPVTCGSFPLTVSKPTATYHFNLLRNAGVIRQYSQGTSKMNVLRKAELDAAFPGLLDSILNAAESSVRPAARPR